MSNSIDGEFSPSDWAQAYFDENGPELAEAAKRVFDNYRLERGEFIVTLQYAPDNESTRVYYVVTLKDKEVMRCPEISAVTSFFAILDEVEELRELAGEESLASYQVILDHCEDLESRLIIAEERAAKAEKELESSLKRHENLESNFKIAKEGKKGGFAGKMFGRFLKINKDAYFFGMLKNCLKYADLNDSPYDLEEIATQLFPKKERDANVDQAIAKNFPINAAAMSYYASCMKLRYEDGTLDDDQYSNMIVALFTYMKECKNWHILRHILSTDMISESYREEFERLVDESELNS